MTNVVMPQMGESIAEGTIVRWIKKVGDTIDRDEPLFEISTDKVDAEIPAPAAGVLTEIKVKEGETVAVNSVVATIGAAGEVKPAGASETVPESAVGQTDAQPAPVTNSEIRGGGRRGGSHSSGPRGSPPAEEFPAGQAHCAGSPRRSQPGTGNRTERPRHQARHPRLHPIGQAQRPSGIDWFASLAGDPRGARPTSLVSMSGLNR